MGGSTSMKRSTHSASIALVASMCLLQVCTAHQAFHHLATGGTYDAIAHFRKDFLSVQSALGLARRSSLTEQCSTLSAISTDDLVTIMEQSGTQGGSTCLKPLLDFYKDTICSDTCINSPLIADMTTRRAGSRHLLGGFSASNPSSSCEDPCFAPFMSGMIQVMKVMMMPECQSLFSDRRAGHSRRLLGGESHSEDSMVALEISVSMLCSKNAVGSYCVELYDNLGNLDDNTTAWSASSSCQASQSVQTQVSSLGCCWGTLVMLSGLSGDSNSADMVSFDQEAQKCDITLTSTPCTDGTGGLEMASVDSTVALSGITVAQFQETSTTTAYKQGVATTAGTTVSSVAITNTVSSRRSGATVSSTVTLTGDQAANQAAVESKLSDSSTLQSNLQTASSSSNLASATVSSSQAAGGYKIEGSSGDSGTGTGVIVGIVIGVLVVVGVAVGVVAYFVTRPSRASDIREGCTGAGDNKPVQQAQPLQPGVGAQPTTMGTAKTEV